MVSGFINSSLLFIRCKTIRCAVFGPIDLSFETILFAIYGGLLNKVILEGDTSKADIVLGLDMNLFDLAEQSGLFTSHSIKDINNIINLPLKWASKLLRFSKTETFVSITGHAWCLVTSRWF